ncbi:MAG: hypothetical protein WB821_13270 [Burkholderiaceae bacterium]
MANNGAAQIQAKRLAHTAVRKPRSALVSGGAVVTDNEAEFTRVEQPAARELVEARRRQLVKRIYL